MSSIGKGLSKLYKADQLSEFFSILFDKNITFAADETAPLCSLHISAQHKHFSLLHFDLVLRRKDNQATSNGFAATHCYLQCESTNDFLWLSLMLRQMDSERVRMTELEEFLIHPAVSERKQHISLSNT